MGARRDLLRERSFTVYFVASFISAMLIQRTPAVVCVLSLNVPAWLAR